jgi:hypothetical protein
MYLLQAVTLFVVGFAVVGQTSPVTSNHGILSIRNAADVPYPDGTDEVSAYFKRGDEVGDEESMYFKREDEVGEEESMYFKRGDEVGDAESTYIKA